MLPLCILLVACAHLLGTHTGYNYINTEVIERQTVIAVNESTKDRESKIYVWKKVAGKTKGPKCLPRAAFVVFHERALPNFGSMLFGLAMREAS